MRNQSPAGPGMGRIAAICGLMTVIFMAVSNFALSGGAPPSRSSSAQHLASLAAQHRIVPEIGYYLDVLAPILFLVFALVLINRAGANGGVWSTVLLIGTTLWIGMDIIFDGAMYALRELAHYGTGVGGVPALFFLGQGILWSNGELFGLIFGSLGILTLRTSVLPSALGWTAIALGVCAFVIPPLALSPLGGFTFAIWLLMLLWIVAASVALFLRAASWAEPETAQTVPTRAALSQT